MDEAAAAAGAAADGWCADCGAPDPTWASRAFGVALCLQCAGAHRGFPGAASKVTSLTLDGWSEDDRAAFRGLGGNAAANERRAATVPPFALRPDTPAAIRQRFCAAKWLGTPFDLREAQQAALASTEQATVNAGILRIELLHGRNLKAADLTGKSDPYVVFGVGRYKEKALRHSLAQSSVVRQTLNPDWNETFMLNVPSLSDGLTAQVYDWDSPPKKHDYLGSAFVDLSNLKDNEQLEVAPPLSKKGYIRFRLTWTKL